MMAELCYHHTRSCSSRNEVAQQCICWPRGQMSRFFTTTTKCILLIKPPNVQVGQENDDSLRGCSQGTCLPAALFRDRSVPWKHTLLYLPVVCPATDLAGKQIIKECNQAALGRGNYMSHIFSMWNWKARMEIEMRHHKHERSKAYKYKGINAMTGSSVNGQMTLEQHVGLKQLKCGSCIISFMLEDGPAG